MSNLDRVGDCLDALATELMLMQSMHVAVTDRRAVASVHTALHSVCEAISLLRDEVATLKGPAPPSAPAIA
jgi:hypothetical protein